MDAAPDFSQPSVEYIRGSDWGGGVGGILYTMRGGQASFNHYNGRGDVVAKTNGVGALTYQATYEAFGTRVFEDGDNQDRQRANTKDESPWGGLNEGMRWRDLETGVFLTRDPAGFIDGPNLYTYVRQNPWTKFDPTGLWIEDLVLGVPSLIMGVKSITHNIKEGNVGAAIVDGIGIVADVGAIALPGVPGGAGLAIKGARAVVKVANKANEAIAIAEDGKAAAGIVKQAIDGDVKGAIKGAVELGANYVGGGKKGGGSKDNSSTGIQQGGGGGQSGGSNGGGGDPSSGSGGCFAEGTLVSTPNGFIRIEELQVGDLVYAYNFETGKVESRKVLETPRNGTQSWILIETNGDLITATRFHRFWIESENDWVYAIDLKPGMVVRLQSGDLIEINKVKKEVTTNRELTFNLEVEHDHNYFVGKHSVLVHNGDSENPKKPKIGTTRHIKTLPKKSKHGSYTAVLEDDSKYHGNGPPSRARSSARKKSRKVKIPVKEIDYTTAESKFEAEIQEAERIKAGGGVENPNNHNIRNSPGAKHLPPDC